MFTLQQDVVKLVLFSLGAVCLQAQDHLWALNQDTATFRTHQEVPPEDTRETLPRDSAWMKHFYFPFFV